jgi:hypothetical protein
MKKKSVSRRALLDRIVRHHGLQGNAFRAMTHAADKSRGHDFALLDGGLNAVIEYFGEAELEPYARALGVLAPLESYTESR